MATRAELAAGDQYHRGRREGQEENYERQDRGGLPAVVKLGHIIERLSIGSAHKEDYGRKDKPTLPDNNQEHEAHHDKGPQSSGARSEPGIN